MFVQTWLAEDIPQANEIDDLLGHPRLCATLKVEEVKTFKSGTISPNATVLEADGEGE